MPMPLICALISSAGLILGSTIGAICSSVASRISLKEQMRFKRESLIYQKKFNTKEKYTNANIVRLDLCTIIYQSIRCLQKYDNFLDVCSISMFKEYHKLIASLSDEFSLKDLSYIYQLYAILDKVFNYIYSVDNINEETWINIRNLLRNILKKVYGENYIKILSIDIDNVSYESLYKNYLMKEGYREVFSSLDKLCKKRL